MSYQPRPIPSSLRSTSLGAPPSQSGPSPILVARINEKKAELENLKQLRDLSAGLAEQMQHLEEKLATLSDGTQAVAAVLSNWHNVLRAINMASIKIPKPKRDEEGDDGDGEGLAKEEEGGVPLPQTLVRIPAEQTDREEQASGSS